MLSGSTPQYVFMNARRVAVTQLAGNARASVDRTCALEAIRPSSKTLALRTSQASYRPGPGARHGLRPATSPINRADRNVATNDGDGRTHG